MTNAATAVYRRVYDEVTKINANAPMMEMLAALCDMIVLLEDKVARNKERERATKMGDVRLFFGMIKDEIECWVSLDTLYLGIIAALILWGLLNIC